METELETTPNVGDARLTPASSCALLTDLVDVLLPGDESWPSAAEPSAFRRSSPLRLLQERGKAIFSRLMKALLDAGAPLQNLDEAARVEVVKRFEASDREMFGWVRDAAYIAYYENPFVAEAINARGHRLRASAAHQRISAGAFRS